MLTAIIVVFVLGYLAIALEHKLNINKAASAIFIGGVCWTLYVLDHENLVKNVPEWFSTQAHASGTHADSLHYLVDGQLMHTLAEIAQILFFLMGAMTIVEQVDAHEGFSIITDRINSRSKRKLLWIVSWLAFVFSAVLDNLTTTIVMVSLLRKIIHDKELRRLFIGIVVIAANAGGAWTVIGDVTTTMLWIKNKIGTVEVMQALLLPSIACLLVPLVGISYFIKGDLDPHDKPQHAHIAKGIQPWHRKLFLGLGLIGLLSVPIFKTYTHLPPFMGMLISLSVMWIVSDLISHTIDEATRSSTGVVGVLKRIDMSSILFFLGILLAVGSLSATGVLSNLAMTLDQSIKSHELVAVIIGLVSAVVDNVPLVAAGIEMYDMPINDKFWMMLAYCAGTGGSCLIIGSAAGVAAMGMEHINFVWYLKKIAPWATLGYFAGVAVYMLQAMLFSTAA
jgi:Na+/H+ antiporter NhaD/arsenite permease-like protein